MRRLIAIASAATALISVTAGAQGAGAVRLQLAPGSQLTFEGTSTLHGFTCTTKTMQAYIDVDPSYRTADLSSIAHPIVAVQVVIPVKSLACGGELENNMFKTLNASKFPYIVYKMSSYDIVGGSASANGFTTDTKGQLAISGKENPIAMSVKTSRGADGVVSAVGEEEIKMTQFGIKPPTFMLGTLRVRDELKIHFNIKATSAAVASAMAELNARLAMTTFDATVAAPRR